MRKLKKKYFKKYVFSPCLDITAYELAVCLNKVLGGGEFNDLPEECKRHFIIQYKSFWKYLFS